MIVFIGAKVRTEGKATEDAKYNPDPRMPKHENTSCRMATFKDQPAAPARRARDEPIA
jgi:hypothetical protein